MKMNTRKTRSTHGPYNNIGGQQRPQVPTLLHSRAQIYDGKRDVAPQRSRSITKTLFMADLPSTILRDQTPTVRHMWKMGTWPMVRP